MLAATAAVTGGASWLATAATRCAPTQDLTAFLGWCTQHAVEPLQAQRPHLDLYLRWMEQRGLAPATIGRRLTTVARFYRYAVIDGHCEEDPSSGVLQKGVRDVASG